jgi:hypothetical protein
MSGAHVYPPKQLLQKDKDTLAIEKELPKDIETLSKAPGLIIISLEYASCIWTLVPIMKTGTAQEIISDIYKEYVQNHGFCRHISNSA